MTMLRSRAPWLMIGSLCLSGCFSINSDLIRTPDAAQGDADPELEGGADAGELVDSEVAVDATDAAEDAGETEQDGGLGFLTDAEVMPPDAAPVYVPCTADSACTPQEFCSKVSLRCEPSCEDARGCAQPIWAFTRGYPRALISTGEVFYWGSAHTQDPAGNARDDARIWAWDLKGPPRAIASGVCSLPMLELDGFLYCQKEAEPQALGGGPTGLYRVRIDGSGQAETLSTLESVVWNTAEHVWWSSAEVEAGSVRSSLWRLARSLGAAPEKLATAPHDNWLGGNAHAVFRTDYAISDTTLLLEEIADLSKVTQVPNAECYANNPTAIDSDALYCTTWQGLKRVPTNGQGTPKFLFRDSAPEATALRWGSAAQTMGDYAYWAFASSDKRLALGRTHKLLREDPQQLLLLSWPYAGLLGVRPIEFAWVRNQLLYYNDTEQRLFLKVLPELR